MKHTPTSSRLTVPSWVNPQGWPPGSARRPPGIHCAGHDSPFGHHPRKGKRVPRTPATCPDTPAHCPCHFPSLFMPFPSPPNVPTLPHAYPTPHFSKPRPDPFPPPWIAMDPVDIIGLCLAWTRLSFSWCVTARACVYAL